MATAGQHQEGIDLLLTDVGIPQMSGHKLAEQLTIVKRRMKVLFMSGYTGDTAVRLGLLADEIKFLSKPFSPNVLSAKVREVLERIMSQYPCLNRILPDAEPAGNDRQHRCRTHQDTVFFI